MSEPGPRPARPGRLTATPLRRLLLGIGIALAGLLALEGMSRLAAATLRENPPAPAPLKWYGYSARLGWVRQPGFTGTVFGVERQFAADGLLAVDAGDLQDHPEWPRVIALGDSTTFGFGVPTDQTYCEQLQRMMPGVNVLNLGMVGYTSFQGEAALTGEGLALKPSVLTVSFNFNDRRFWLPPDQPDSAARFEHLAREQALRTFARHSYLVRLLARLAGRPLNAESANDESVQINVSRSPLTHVDVRALRPRVAPEDYRRNLTAMVQTARQEGIEVVFLLFADAPDDKAPLEAAIARADAGELEEAARMLEALLDDKNLYRILARIELAGIEEQLGRPEEAQRVGFIDHPIYTLHGGEPVERDETYRQIMQAVAGALEVPVIDAGARMAEQPEVYLDFCHFNGEGHQIVAEQLYPVIQKSLARRSELN